MQIDNFKNKINKLSSKGVPFLFLIDFEMKNPHVFTLEETIKNNIFYNIKGFTNFPEKLIKKRFQNLK